MREWEDIRRRYSRELRQFVDLHIEAIFLLGLMPKEQALLQDYYRGQGEALEDWIEAQTDRRKLLY